ncbi:hypothetical protein [Ralstonia holmesii]|uniref:hypothetical protein n=1 Tax=Ralstonia holmesii TaxID=3058602 RepID=UPI003D64CFCC
MKTMYLVLGGLALWAVSRRRAPEASETMPAANGWYTYAPKEPSDWYGDMWQRLSGGDLFPQGHNDAPGGGMFMNGAPVGNYIDPTNAGGTTLATDPNAPYQALPVNHASPIPGVMRIL